MGRPTLPDVQTLIQAGIDPKTGLPLKLGGDGSTLKRDIKQALRIIDEQNAVSRFKWYNLPEGITSQELERMLYYKGQLCFFYFEQLDKFYFMPYALDGTIDFYGRYNQIHPVPMTSGKEEEKSERYKSQAAILSNVKLDCVHDVVQNEVTYEDMVRSCVLLHDYQKQMGQIITPRYLVNDCIIDSEANCIPFMQTALISGTGIKGVRVNDGDQADSVFKGSASLVNAALSQRPWVSIVGQIEFQELTNGQVAKAEEYMLAMQSLDNLRLSTYGLENGGLFEKKAHELQAEANMASANVGLVMQSDLEIRQHFCDVVNSIWGLGIWVTPSESVVGQDMNGDGVAFDNSTDGPMVEGGSNDANDTTI